MKKLIKKMISYQFVRYTIGGGLAAILDLFILRVCTDFFGIFYMLSAVIAFLISCTFGYLFQKYITFKNTSKNHIRQGGLFVFFQLIGLGIYLIILWIGVNVLGLWYLAIAVIAKLIAFIWNYLSNHFLNFNHQ